MKITRRGFAKLCVSAVPLWGKVSAVIANEQTVARRYQRVKLVNGRDQPIHSSDLTVGETYIFHYPYITTPCFILNLGQRTARDVELSREDGVRYHWPGGVGPKGSVVAYSAICAHMMTHPARTVSFINYRHEPVTFKDTQEERVRRSNVIYCCSEKSVYDAAQGAHVLGGPAPQPLAVIVLEHRAEDDTYFATGTEGGEMFGRFFKEFDHRLTLEHQTKDVRRETTDRVVVLTLNEYCKNQVRC